MGISLFIKYWIIFLLVTIFHLYYKTLEFELIVIVYLCWCCKIRNHVVSSLECKPVISRYCQHRYLLAMLVTYFINQEICEFLSVWPTGSCCSCRKPVCLVFNATANQRLDVLPSLKKVILRKSLIPEGDDNNIVLPECQTSMRQTDQHPPIHLHN